MNKSAYTYLGVLILAAAVLTWQLSLADYYPFGNFRQLIGFATFILLAVGSQISAVKASIGADRQMRSSISFLPVFACAIVFSPLATIIAGVSVLIVAEAVRHNRVVWQIAFNLAQTILAYGLAALTYDHIATSYGPSLFFELLAFLGLTIVFFSANFLFVSVMFALREQTSLFKIIGKIVGPSAGNLWYGLLASPLAFVAAVLYGQLYIGGLVLIILPLLLIRYSYESRSKLEQVNRELLGVLIKALETRDPYTSGHSIRVSMLARLIAQELKLSRQKFDQVEAAALLHDIGKMDPTFSAVIAKRGSLSDNERALIRTHTIKGAELLETMAPSLGEEVILSVRHHHEWYNGGGYPDGLKGDQTPLPARIIAVCDAIDAMLSVRPYRSARTPEQTRNELSRCVGGQFDPELTRIATAGDLIERAAERIRDIGEDNTYIPRSA